MNICDTCGTAYQVNENFDKHVCDDAETKQSILLNQYRKALVGFGVTFADNGLIRKIPRHGTDADADEFDAKGDAWDEFLNRKNPIEHSDSYAGFQFGWNAAIAYMKGEKYRQVRLPELCKCAIRDSFLAECRRCGKPYHADGRIWGGMYA